MVETGSKHATNPFQRLSRSDNLFAWFRRHELLLLSVGVTLQLAILAGMIAYRAMPLVTGETVLLRVVPVDPRDPFRGDYVILSYDFSRGSTVGIEWGGTVGRGRRDNSQRTVFVSLVRESDGRHWRTDKISVNRPADGTYLVGTWQNGRVQCGIEAFFVQEGQGRDYEQAIRNRRLSAEVAVTSRGQATLRGLKIE